MQTLPTLCLSLTLTLAPAFAMAEAAPDFVQPYIEQLAEQGYGEMSVGSTWLGRIIITATRDGTAREIVLSRRTGALLSDSALLPPSSERLSMQPTSDSASVTASQPAPDPDPGVAVTVTFDGIDSDLLDAGEVKERSVSTDKMTPD